jgi:hypothetical protein
VLVAQRVRLVWEETLGLLTARLSLQKAEAREATAQQEQAEVPALALAHLNILEGLEVPRLDLLMAAEAAVVPVGRMATERMVGKASTQAVVAVAETAAEQPRA